MAEGAFLYLGLHVVAVVAVYFTAVFVVAFDAVVEQVRYCALYPALGPLFCALALALRCYHVVSAVDGGYLVLADVERGVCCGCRR